MPGWGTTAANCATRLRWAPVALGAPPDAATGIDGE